MPDIQIRGFEPRDRAAVRRISCETSFLQEDRRLFLDNDEVLADALTLYYTDYEPGSCFVAVAAGRVVGYIIGTLDVHRMETVVSGKIWPGLIWKALRRGLFCRLRVWRLLFHVVTSALKGEFRAPHFAAQYPGMLHINIDQDHRGKEIGRKLIERYLSHLREHHVDGVHFGSMSEKAKEFFLRSGFKLLHVSQRSYLKYRTGEIFPFYILGMKMMIRS